MKNAQRITALLFRRNSDRIVCSLQVRLFVCFILICLCAPGCTDASKKDSPSGQATAPIQKGAAELRDVLFADATKSLGINHTYLNGEDQNKYTILEAGGGGVAAIDFDRDGRQDLFFPGGGQITESNSLTPLPGSLWLNREGKGYLDVSVPSGANAVKYYTQGTAAADINNDGFPDLLVTGYGGLQLFVNRGDGTFQELADASGLVDPVWSTSAGFGDFDGDGALDLYVAHYADWSWEKNPECLSSARIRDVCPPGAFVGLQDVVFMSNGDGSYRSVTSEIGLVPEGRGLGVICADLNHDSKVDVYVANDTTNNFLYVNTGDGKFSEQGVASGTALDERGTANGSMGVAVFDFEGDLKPDLWVCNYENETFALYKNDGNVNFRHITSSTGITALGTLFVAFGTVAADFDSDGDEDLVVANGHVLRFPAGNSADQSPLFLRNSGKGRLSRQSFEKESYFSNKWRGRGAIGLDFDRDGDIDLAMSHINQPSAVLENKTLTKGKWIQLELIGTKSNRDAIGGRVLFSTNKKQYLRHVIGGGSYLSQNPYLVHCAFPPDETLEKVEVFWPNGGTQSLGNVAVNQYCQIVEAGTSAP